MYHIEASSETGSLKTVIVGYPDNFLDVEPEIINETQKQFYFGEEKPRKEDVINQINGFVKTLRENGVEVLQPKPLAYLPDQLMTRDIGVVIGNTFLITSMAADSRRREWRGISHLFSDFNQDARILIAPEEFVLEGGDIIVDKGNIYVGVGQRTDHIGVAYLFRHFPEYRVIPIQLKSLNDGEDVLHLDCSFVPVGEKHALIYRDGMHYIPDTILNDYELIDITKEEQSGLGTNVISIDPKTVVSRKSSVRINQELSKVGLNVIELPFSEPPKTGGSFRCCTLPLYRE